MNPTENPNGSAENGNISLVPAKLRWAAPSVEAFSVLNDPSAVNKVQEYLEYWGHLDPAKENLTSGLKAFQKDAQIPITGVYDAATAEMMDTPRCGFAHTGLGWNIGGGTWPHQNMTYRWDGFWNAIPRLSQCHAIQKAFNTWGEVIPLFFQAVTDGQNADIKLKFAVGDHGDGASFDGKLGVLAHAFLPPGDYPPLDGDRGGQVHFDGAESWDEGFLHTIALHEIGHSLGLQESDDKNAVMWKFYIKNRNTLTQDDIDGIQYKYQFGPWRELGTTTESPIVQILAVGDNVCTLHKNGNIYQYVKNIDGLETGVWSWSYIDGNPDNVQLSWGGKELFLLHTTGDIWKYTGNPLDRFQSVKWEPLSGGTPGDTVEIAASANTVYKLLKNGQIWRYRPDLNGWEIVNENKDINHIVASSSGRLYELHKDGSAWAFDGSPYNWHFLFSGSTGTVQLAAGDMNQLYRLQKDGKIFKMTPEEDWELLSDNPNAKSLFAIGDDVYQVLKSRSILKLVGMSAGLGWWHGLDRDEKTTMVCASEEGTVWQVANGKVYEQRL